MPKLKKVLIVEDSVVTRRMLESILHKDYNVLQAANGQEAMKVLNELKSDVSIIILDLNMPVMDGLTFLGEMQKVKELMNIPVLVVTKSVDQQSELEALAAGATDFIRKPYNPQAMKHRIDNLIKLREGNATLKSMEHDVLTDVYSNDFFISQVESYLKAHPDEDFDLLATDVQDFKLFNEVYDFNLGDNLLRFIAGVLTSNKLLNTIMCGRIGADSFILLAEHKKYTESIFTAVNQEINKFPIDMHIVIRFGVYHIVDRSLPVASMVDSATVAVESLKDKFSTFYVSYDEKVKKKLLLKQQISSNMWKALEDGEFKLYLQPKYNLRTNKIAGAEALVRWVTKDNVIMSPGDFIPIFEQNGFITTMDRYVWEEAAKALKTFKDMGIKPFAISINLSRRDLYNDDLVQILLDMLKKYGLDERYLHLEITESAYTDNPEQIIKMTRALREAGFIIEMDDFGKGASSLTMLSALPIDILKMDMGFVDNSASRRILGFVISLAKWLGVGIIVEGVETKEQRLELLGLDCTYAQGYYYSKPVPLDAFINLLHTTEIDESKIEISNKIDFQDSVSVDSEQKDKKFMLLVDDLQLNRIVLKSMFHNAFNIAETDNGKAALQFLEEHGADTAIVLLDLMMPVMDGFEVLAQVRSNPKLKNIPIIVTSQHDSFAESKVIRLGADDFITEPFNADVCKKRVANVIAANKEKH